MKSVLSIAGSDSSGGAGIQADIKTIESNGLYAQTAITALTAQNTTGVYGIEEADPDFIAKQIDVVFDDIRPDAVKIGMVPSAASARMIAESLARNSAENIVLDPVMVATSGSELADGESVKAMVDYLMPLATVITPNIPEAEVLSGITIACADDMVQAARIIQGRMESPLTPAILVKGGHFDGVTEDLISAAFDDVNSVSNPSMPGAPVMSDGKESANDFLLDRDGQEIWICGERIDNPNTHGTGCTLSSAIACGLAMGESVEGACRSAKEYLARILQSGLSDGFDLGEGPGPLHHSMTHPCAID